MSHIRPAYLLLALIIGLSAVSFIWDAPLDFLTQVIGENRLLGACIFTVLMFLATVIAPVSMLPAVPLVSPILGPFLTGTLSLIGWTLGAVVAFLIARHAGRPLLTRFVSLDTLERYESYIPKEAHFLTVVFLRMLIPVDVLSYALGLFSSISLIQYTLASAIGITWFSYAFAYLGSAASEKNIVLFIVLSSISLAILSISWLYIAAQKPRGNSK